MGSPIGIACSEPTIYLDDAYNVWTNTGPGPNDWVQLGTSDPFQNALFDVCDPMFDHDPLTGNVELLEECG